MYNLFDFKITDKSTNQQKKVLHKGLPSVTSLIVEWYDIVTICNLGHTQYTFKTTFRKKKIGFIVLNLIASMNVL